jgi:hypothetical protein
MNWPGVHTIGRDSRCVGPGPGVGLALPVAGRARPRAGRSGRGLPASRTVTSLTRRLACQCDLRPAASGDRWTRTDSVTVSLAVIQVQVRHGLAAATVTLSVTRRLRVGPGH